MAFQAKQLELNDRMDLSSYLLKPVQRMGKYALLLAQITDECPTTHPDHGDLKVIYSSIFKSLPVGMNPISSYRNVT